MNNGRFSKQFTTKKENELSLCKIESLSIDNRLFEMEHFLFYFFGRGVVTAKETLTYFK
jgi:hypothetical protein